MIDKWQIFLASRGAVYANDVVHHFGNAASELVATDQGAVIADLSHDGLLHVSGADALTFLQGQLTQDISKITTSRAALAGYCSPKGRLLAHFLVWQQNDGYCLQLPRELLAVIQKRLQMYVLRSKVKLQDISAQTLRFGLAGPHIPMALSTACGETRQEAWSVTSCLGGSVITLPGGRYQVVANENAEALWTTLSDTATQVGEPCWRWLRIQTGLPEIYLATQDQFVPQMVNDDLIGAVNFQKGCYTGQEIVARMHYLGKPKRRMYRAHLRDGGQPKPGDLLYSEEMQGQASGMVVDGAPAPKGGWDGLVSVQVESANTQPIYWPKLAGEKLVLAALMENLT